MKRCEEEGVLRSIEKCKWRPNSQIFAYIQLRIFGGPEKSFSEGQIIGNKKGARKGAQKNARLVIEQAWNS